MSDEKTSHRKSTLVDSELARTEKPAPPETHSRAVGATQHVSDVVPVDEEPTPQYVGTAFRDVSDVKLAESISDVKLAEPASDVKLVGSISDASIANAATGAAPSFRMPASPLGPRAPGNDLGTPPAGKTVANRKLPNSTPMALLPGAKVDDFEIVRLLGRGAFGHVYLARQMSLDRHVALKISANRGSEGRTMARLEHQHIVQVFAEKVDTDFDQRLLCMQLVPGIGLDKLINSLHQIQVTRVEESSRKGGPVKPAAPVPVAEPSAIDWTGADMLAIIDQAESLPTALDPSALHDREALGKMDAVEATAWFGTRLAEALDFAHGHGVLHRDIKPANILVNPYGRPMLADFNISSQPVGSEVSGEEMFGGTFAYMSPEHLDAFNPGHPTGHEAVTARSDVYSLGLVLQQLLEGRIGFPQFDRKAKMADTLRAMADERRRAAPACKTDVPGARMTLERSITRCLEPNPEDRYASGAELGAQLESARRIREAERRLPKLRPVFYPVLRRPFLWLVLLTMLPQIGGSIFNIAYNVTQIVDTLSPAQKSTFKLVLGIYNVIVYPIGAVAFVVMVRRVWRVWNALSTAARVPEAEVQLAREQALRLPRGIAILNAFGWFPGGLLFPFLISVLTTPLPLQTYVHFMVSFCLSGLVALSYSLCGVEFVVLRGLYPGMWQSASKFTEQARQELTPVYRQLNRIELFAVSIPLVSALLTLMLSDIKDNEAFRYIVATLIVMGILGFHLTSAVVNHLTRVLVALTNAKD
jgi:eukaryotic-like serine/threonine-protein kinase